MTWYYSNNNERYGPVTAAELEQLVQSGVVTGETLVWREGMPDWQPWRVASAQMAQSSPAGDSAAPMYKLRGASAPTPEASADSPGSQGRSGVEAETGKPIEFEFSGSGGEYFRVWIVNVLLTIATLGIYAAWAKVRSKRYFYAHTSFAGHAFEYLAEPKRILIGNLIVVGVALLFQLSVVISPVLQGVFMLVIAAAVPWVIARSVLFNARNSAWRGLRFGFGGNYGGAFFNFVLLPILVPFTLGLLFPYIVKRQREWLIENHRYGTTSFGFGGQTGDYYMIYLKALLFFIPPVVFGVLMAGMGVAMGRNGGPAMALTMLTPVVAFACVIVGSAFVRASLFAYAWSHTRIGSHSFFSSMRTRDLVWLHVVNLVVTVLTLGLAWPWAAVRTARFQLSCLVLVPGGGSLDSFVGQSQPEPGAISDVAGDFLDFDIGFGV